MKSGGPLVGRPRPGGRPRAGAHGPAGADPPRRPGVRGPDVPGGGGPGDVGAAPALVPGGLGVPAPPALGTQTGAFVPQRALDLAGALSGPFRPGPTCLTSVAIAGHRGSPLLPLSPRDAPWLSGGVTSGGRRAASRGGRRVESGGEIYEVAGHDQLGAGFERGAWHTASSKSWNADSAVRTVRSVTAATRSRESRWARTARLRAVPT